MAPSGTTPHHWTPHPTLIFSFAESSPSSRFLSSPTVDVLLWTTEALTRQETPSVHQLGGLTYYFLEMPRKYRYTEAYHRLPVGSIEGSISAL
jgi:hypothetical protein